MTVKVTYELDERAAIDAVIRMGGFSGMTLENRMAIVKNHRDNSRFKQLASLECLPDINKEHAKHGYRMIKIEVAQ